jgi:phytoene synthase
VAGPALDIERDLARTDPDRWLSSRLIGDPALRRDVSTLYAFDEALARAARQPGHPLAAQIRLTWWRETLEAFGQAQGPQQEPLAEAVRTLVSRRRAPLPALVAMIEAHGLALGPQGPALDRALDWALGGPGGAAVLAAGMLDPDGEAELARPCGAVWGLLSLRRARRFADLDLEVLALRQWSLAEAAARRITAGAFPAVAHATLARVRTPSWIGARGRLIWAAARGRI